MIYHCTKPMLDILNISPKPELDIYSKTFSWQVKLLKHGKHRLVYAMNEASKLSVIIDEMHTEDFAKFEVIFYESLRQVLLDMGISESIVEAYVEDGIDSIYTLINNKKEVGIINRAAMEMEYFIHELGEPGYCQRRLSQRQNHVVIHNNRGEAIIPARTMKNILEKDYGDGHGDFDIDTIRLYMFEEQPKNQTAYLHIKDGSIQVIEDNRRSFLWDEKKQVLIPPKRYSFIWEFDHFAEGIKNLKFLTEFELQKNGKGASQRIHTLLVQYPKIQEKWEIYKGNIERQIVKNWLRDMGLL